jgi:hypothetical protein
MAICFSAGFSYSFLMWPRFAVCWVIWLGVMALFFVIFLYLEASQTAIIVCFFSSFLCTVVNTAEPAVSQNRLCRRMLGLNPGLLQLWHLTARRSNHLARSQPHCCRQQALTPDQGFQIQQSWLGSIAI